MTSGFSFSITYSNQTKASHQEIVFPVGLNIIYGESGVGKSQLAQLLSGVVTKDQCKFEVDNISIKSDIYIVQQNPDQQIISNSILNELAFNIECKNRNSDKIEDELETIIKELLFDVNLERHPTTLSGGEKELLNISTTQSLNPYVLILDDALSFLSNEMKNKVVKILKKQNSIVLWFTSDKNDFQFSDSSWEMTENSIHILKTNSDIVIDKCDLLDGEIGLHISELQFAYENDKIFSNLNTLVERFRCLGIIGENGCGKSTLASLLLNIEKPDSGYVKLTRKDESELSIGFLDQFPERLIGIITIDEFVAKLISNNILNESNIPTIVKDLNTFDIVWENIKAIPGNQLSWTTLRIALICILANSKYDLLILDEPTFGMGENQKNNLRSYLIRYLDKKHLILISHDKLFLESICDKTIKL